MSEICYEPSQIFQPSGARAAPSWLDPPIRLLRSCPVFDALGVGREALRLFDVGQARAHLEGAVDPVSCPVCAYDERNRALHGYMQESLF